MRKFLYTYRGDVQNSLRNPCSEEEMVKRILNNGPRSFEYVKHFKVYEIKEVKINASEKEVTKIVTEFSCSISS